MKINLEEPFRHPKIVMSSVCTINIRTHRYTDTHTQVHRHTDTHAQKQIYRHTQIHKHTHRYTDIQTHIHAHTYPDHHLSSQTQIETGYGEMERIYIHPDSCM